MSRRVVAVLGGGTSPERGISLMTAKSVRESLPPDEFDSCFVEIGPDGLWSVEGGPPVRAAAAASALHDAGVSVVFPGLHGRYGEDGTIQGFLEVAGFPYVGSGVAASALAMDKCRTREVLAAHGVPLPGGIEFSGESPEDAAAEAIRRLSLPAVVKHPTGGSSLEMKLVRDRSECLAALAEMLGSSGGRALVEEFVPGTELTCAVLGNASRGGGLEALPVVLIRPRRATWFDFATKYDPDAVDELCPAPVAAEVRARVADLSLLAHRVLRCDGLTRTDFIVPADGVPRFLELNTLPGLTPASISPKAAAAAGITFPELLRRLVRMALAKEIE